MTTTNKLILGDAYENLQKMSDNSVDISITSPPYNLKHLIRYDKKNNKYYHKLPYLKHIDDMKEYGTFLNDIVKELIRVSKYNVFFNIQMLLGNKLDFINLLYNYKYNLKDIIIWHKKNAQPSINKTQLSSNFEFILVFSKKENCTSKPFNYAFFNNRERGQKNPNVIYGNSSGGTEIKSSNFAYFPEYMVKWIIDRFTKEGDLVLDPFIGSGTTAVVAKKYGRSSIGIDNDEEYIKYATERINKVVPFKKWW